MDVAPEARARGPRKKGSKGGEKQPSQEARVEEEHLEVGRKEGVSGRTKWPAVSTAAGD